MIGSLRPDTRIDLHLHTTRSDGKYEPAEVLRRCARGGLDLIALTDHDLGSPVATGLHEVEGRQLHVLGGAEISGQHAGREYHLLVYFPGPIPDGFQDFCAAQCRERAERYDAAVQNLEMDDLPPSDTDARAGRRALTRLHLARALVATGRARDSHDAFAQYLGGAHGHVPHLSLSMTDAIRVARAHGGVTSWAHPSVPDVDRHLDTFVAAGLQGLEGLRPWISAKDRNYLRRMARRHGLFLTGGSDWHGWSGDDPGLFRLQARELTDFLEALQAA